LLDELIVPQELLDNTIITKNNTTNPWEKYILHLCNYFEYNINIIFDDTKEYITTANFMFIGQEYLGRYNTLMHLFCLAETT
jgi:hypothetical protein